MIRSLLVTLAFVLPAHADQELRHIITFGEEAWRSSYCHARLAQPLDWPDRVVIVLYEEWGEAMATWAAVPHRWTGRKWDWCWIRFTDRGCELIRLEATQ